MASITKEQQATIRTLVRRANRRIERTMEGITSKGQKAALEYYVKKAIGANKWSAATKGMTKAGASAYIRQLESFLASQSTTKTGWEIDIKTGKGRHTGKGWRYMKSESVSKANETLTEQGYDLTDEELAEILVQIDTADRKEFYRAVNLVQAAKEDKGDKWSGSKNQIRKALQEKATFQQAFEKVFTGREKK